MELFVGTGVGFWGRCCVLLGRPDGQATATFLERLKVPKGREAIAVKSV